MDGMGKETEVEAFSLLSSNPQLAASLLRPLLMLVPFNP